jgi:hypothetical protein
MKTSALLARFACVAILLFAFSVAVYRAKTQSIAHDEALTYEWFLDSGVSHVLLYNLTNHVLLTLMAKPIVWAWGITEFKLRLPSLIGTAVYLIFSYLLSRKLFGDGILAFVAVALLSLNPEVLDLMPAARGYLLGLGCLSAAMYLLARMAGRGLFDPDDKEWRSACFFASVFLGLSVVANLTNVIAAACLALSFSTEAMGGFRTLMNLKDSRLRGFATYFVLPGATTGFSLLWPYLIQARLGTFRVSMGRASDAIQSVFRGTFLHKWTDDPFGGPGTVMPPAGSWQERITTLGEYLVLPVLLGLVVAAVILAWKAATRSTSPQSAYCRIFGGAAAASVALIVILHVALKVDYPVSRYCLFLIPLFTISGLLACREIYALHPRMYLKAIGFVVGAAILVDYSLSLQTTTFRYTAYDVISRDLYQAIEKDARSLGLNNVKVGGTWWYEPEINFYRRRFNARWMLPFDIKDHSSVWETPNSLTPADYDYFVFLPANDPGLGGPRVRTIFHDGRTKATIIAIGRQ